MTLPKYDSYKDSGTPWIGEIPEQWEVIKLRFIGEFSASGIDKFSKKNESKIKIINYTNIYGNLNKTIDSSYNLMVVTTPEKNKNKHLVKKGDLLFLPSSETYEDLGVAGLINEDLRNTSFSYHLIRLKFNRSLNHSFKKYFTNNNFVLNQFAKQGKGTTRKIIGRDVFKNIIVVLPLISEQARIASFLDRRTAEIDDAIIKKVRLIELLKEEKSVIINQAVTKGLNPNAPMRDSGIEWIGEIPKHWNIERTKFLFSQSRLPVRKGDGVVTAFRDGEVTLRTNRRTNGFTVAILEQGYQGIRRGQLILNSMDAFAGAIGVSDSNGKCSPEYVICDPLDANKVQPMYFAFLLREMAMSKYIQVICPAVRQRAMRIRFNNLAILLLICPPIEEQDAIVEYIVKKSAEIATLIEKTKQEIEKLKEFKSVLISEAVTGKIKVTKNAS